MRVTGITAGDIEESSPGNLRAGGHVQGKRRPIASLVGGDGLPEIDGFVVVRAKPVAGHISRVIGGDGRLVAAEQNTSGKDVITGAPWFQRFGLTAILVRLLKFT